MAKKNAKRKPQTELTEQEQGQEPQDAAAEVPSRFKAVLLDGDRTVEACGVVVVASGALVFLDDNDDTILVYPAGAWRSVERLPDEVPA